MTTLEPGAILSSTWGYDQTNASFWRVERITKGGWVILARLEAIEESDGPQTMTGRVTPGQPTGEQIRRKPRFTSYGVSITIDQGIEYAQEWNGRPVSVSHYA